MDSGIISGIITIVFIAVFIGIVWWAYSKDNQPLFEQAARLPFDEDDAHPTSVKGDKQ
ncbi:MAG: cbb3-type cytochrome c oxidase subunit 3 [Thiobacillus sp.]